MFWHRDGYLANRVPPLTGSGSAQNCSKGRTQSLCSGPCHKYLYIHNKRRAFPTYSRLGTLDLFRMAPKRSAVLELIGRLKICVAGVP